MTYYCIVDHFDHVTFDRGDEGNAKGQIDMLRSVTGNGLSWFEWPGSFQE
jgi:hypothetical protein